MRYSALTAMIVLTLTGCAGAGGAGAAAGGSSDVITSEQLRELGVSTAYDAIQRLRPRFLRGRVGSMGTRDAGNALTRSSAGGNGSQVVVYVDGSRAGGVGELRSIPVDVVREIRYVNGRDATTKYGTDHGAGVIEVSTH